MHFKHFTRLFLLIGMIGLMSNSARAQMDPGNRELVTIGTGTNPTTLAPIYTPQNYSLTQQIYTADEIDTDGLITSIGFHYVYNETKTFNVDVFMKHVSIDGFSDNKDKVALTSSDKVFSGNITASTGWVTITLDQPFDYNGTSNLLIAVDNNTGTGFYIFSGGVWEYTSTSLNGKYSILYSGNSTNIDPYNPSVFTVNYSRPNLQLSITSTATCPKPHDLTIDNLTATSANLVWTAGGDEQEWDILLLNDATIPDENAPATISSVTNNPYALTLNQNTTYYAYVRAVCGGDDKSRWSRALSFTTPQVAIELGTSNPTFEDGFETSCDWILINGDRPNQWCWGTATHNGIGSTKALYVSNDNGQTNAYSEGYGNYCMVYASKLFNLEEGTYTFSFDWRCKGTSTSDYLRVALVPANTELTASSSTPSGFSYNSLPTGWIALDGGSKLNLQETWTTQVNDLHVATGSYKMVFAWRNGSYSQNNPPAAVDNIRIDYQSCPRPLNVVATNVEARTATLSWTPGTTGQSNWEIFHTTVGSIVPNDQPTAMAQTTGNNYTFSFAANTLTPATTYYTFVRADCGSGDKSPWSEVCSFTTEPSCQTPSNLTAMVLDANSARLDWTPRSGENAWEIYVTQSADVPGNNVTGASVETHPTTVSITPNTTYYAYVRANCGGNDGKSAWSNAVTIYAGYCQPAPTSVDRNGITNVTFGTGNEVVNNSQRPTSSPFYGDYSSQIGAAPAGSEVSVAITYETGYTYGTLIWIDWNNNFEFEDSEIMYVGESTNSNPTTLNASFMVSSTQSVGHYRMRIGGADSYFNSYVNSNPHTGKHSPCYSSGYAVFHDYTLHVTEAPSCPMPTHFEVDEQARTASFSWTAGGSETQWEFSCSETSGAPEQGSVISDNPHTVNNLQPNTQYYAYIRAICDTENGDYSDWMELSFTTAEACPAPTNLTYNGVGSNVATVSWTAGATGQNAWNLQYKKHSDTDWSDPIEVNDANSYQLTGLSAITSYDVQVQAVCGDEDGQSTWLTKTNLFTTDCGALELPYSYGFEENVATGSYPMPKCWNRIAYSTQNNPNAKYPYVHEATNSQPYAHGGNGNNSTSGHSLYLWRNSSSSNEAAILPEMDGSYDMNKIQISFWARLHNNATNQTLSIGVMNSTTSGYSEVATVNIESDHFTPYTVSLADYNGTGRYIAIKCGSGSDVKYYIDDITVNYIPSCQIPTELAATVNSASLTTLIWQPGGNETEWELEVIDENSNITQTISVTDNPTYTLTTNRATTYSASVRAICGGDDFSDWSNPISFTTECGILPVDAQNPFFEDFNGTTFPPTCWQKVNFGELGETNGWQVNMNNNLDDQGAVSSDFKGETWLFLPHMHIEGNATLSFDNLFSTGTSYCTSSIMVSTDAIDNLESIKEEGFIGEHFTQIWAADPTNLPSTKRNETVSLGSYNGQDVHIAFRYEGSYTTGQRTWYIDNVEVYVEATQAVTLTQGWNWWSPTVETTLEELETAIGINGITIKSQDAGFADYDEEDQEWTGNLDAIVSGQMYKIQVNAECIFTLSGKALSNVNITIEQGHNWFGYTGLQTITINQAFENFTPAEGDRINAFDGHFANYEDGEWIGNLTHLQPGQGYIYNSQDTNSKTLIFNKNQLIQQTK